MSDPLEALFLGSTNINHINYSASIYRALIRQYVIEKKIVHGLENDDKAATSATQLFSHPLIGPRRLQIAALRLAINYAEAHGDHPTMARTTQRLLASFFEALSPLEQWQAASEIGITSKAINTASYLFGLSRLQMLKSIVPCS